MVAAGAVFAMGIGAEAAALAVSAMTRARLLDGCHIFSPNIGVDEDGFAAATVLSGDKFLLNHSSGRRNKGSLALSSSSVQIFGSGFGGFSFLPMISSAAMTCARLRKP